MKYGTRCINCGLTSRYLDSLPLPAIVWWLNVSAADMIFIGKPATPVVTVEDVEDELKHMRVIFL